MSMTCEMYMICFIRKIMTVKDIYFNEQKQPFADVLQNRCS